MLKASRRDGGNQWEPIAVKGGSFNGLARTYIDAVERLNSGGIVAFFGLHFWLSGFQDIPGIGPRDRQPQNPNPEVVFNARFKPWWLRKYCPIPSLLLKAENEGDNSYSPDITSQQ